MTQQPRCIPCDIEESTLKCPRCGSYTLFPYVTPMPPSDDDPFGRIMILLPFWILGAALADSWLYPANFWFIILASVPAPIAVHLVLRNRRQSKLEREAEQQRAATNFTRQVAGLSVPASDVSRNASQLQQAIAAIRPVDPARTDRLTIQHIQAVDGFRCGSGEPRTQASALNKRATGIIPPVLGAATMSGQASLPDVEIKLKDEYALRAISDFLEREKHRRQTPQDAELRSGWFARQLADAAAQPGFAAMESVVKSWLTAWLLEREDVWQE